MRRLDTDQLEQLRMTQRQLYELPDLHHLFTASTDVVVSDIRQVCLLLTGLPSEEIRVSVTFICSS